MKQASMRKQWRYHKGVRQKKKPKTKNKTSQYCILNERNVMVSVLSYLNHIHSNIAWLVALPPRWSRLINPAKERIWYLYMQAHGLRAES